MKSIDTVVGLEHPYLPLFVFGVLCCVYILFWDPCTGVGDLSQQDRAAYGTGTEQGLPTN